jgi:hypothetical protein
VSLAGSFDARVGQPATVRVGIVVGLSPLRVNVQGSIFTELGLIGAAPSVGDTVLLLGQAVQGAGSSGSSWVCLGEIVAA